MMRTRDEAMRRGLRMAAQVAAMGALAMATASVAQGSEPPAQDSKGEPGAAARAASIFRVDGRAGGCMPSWGPPAPPACLAEEIAQWMTEVGS